MVSFSQLPAVKTRTMWNRSMIASQSVLRKSPKKGPFSGTYKGQLNSE
jgi:hypothetical protein